MESFSIEYHEAVDQLRVVNEIFVRSRLYRNLPGASGITAGLLALFGGTLFGWTYGSAADFPLAFIATWTLVWVLALMSHLFFSIRNANRRMEPVLSEVALLLAQTILPALAVAAILAVAMVRLGQVELLAGLWILVYGMGVLSCRPYVDPWIGWFGWSFLIIGSIHLVWLPGHSNGFMTLSFGLLHLGYGLRTSWIDAANDKARKERRK